MRLIDADHLKERIGDVKFHNYGYALMMVCEEPTVTDINAGCKTDTITKQWVHESIRTGNEVLAYSRCPMCGGSVDGYVNYRYCHHCGEKLGK